MNLTRTTVRIEPPLKKAAQSKALELNITLQDLFTLALKDFLGKKTKEKSTKILFHSQDIGESLNNLTREDLYVD